MRTKLTMMFLALLAALVAGQQASAQYPYGGYGGGYGGYGRYGYGGAGLPGYGGYGAYRGIGGSLSPYLNLTNRGAGNAATNYYNFVRPGLNNPALGVPGAGFGSTYMNRPPLFPQMPEDDERKRAIADLAERGDQAKQHGLPPTGHPTFFNETFGFFGPYSSTPGLGMGGRSSPAARSGRPR